MRSVRLFTCALTIVSTCSFLRADSVPVYRIDTFAGAFSLGDGGPATSAALLQPEFVRFDSAGNLYITDISNYRIRKVAPNGIITTVAGNGASTLPADGSQALQTGLGVVRAIAISPAGILHFVSETLATPQIASVYRINQDGSITRIAGGGTASPGDGGTATLAKLGRIRGMIFDPQGNLYFSDFVNQVVRKVTVGGIITTIAGTGVSGNTGDGAAATSARLNSPRGLAFDSAQNLYIGTLVGVRKIGADGKISTFAGNGASGSSGDGGAATSASVLAWDIAFDAAGSLYICENTNARIRKVTADGKINAFAGTGQMGSSGDGGQAQSATLNGPAGITVDAAGNVYIAEFNSGIIRKIALNGLTSTFAGVRRFAGDGGQAGVATFNFPSGVAIDATGNTYVADTANHRIRKITPAGIVSTVAGNGAAGFSGDGAIATAASLNQPVGVAVDSAGNIYIADQLNNRVRKVTPAGIITTFAGTGTAGAAGDGASATSAQLNSPAGLAIDSAGNLLIADSGNNLVRKVAGGILSTIAGTGKAGYSGDGGPAKGATLSFPYGLAVDAQDNVFIADSGNSAIRRVTVGGIISTVAGNGKAGSSGDSVAATSVSLGDPNSVAVDTAGDIFFADDVTNLIQQISSDGTLHTVAGGAITPGRDGSAAVNAILNGPLGMARDIQGNLLFAAGQSILKLSVPTGSLATAVANAATFGKLVAPGSLISIFGVNFGTSDSNANGFPLPLVFGDLSATVNNIAIPLVFANATQINAQLPFEATPGPAVLTVTGRGQTSTLGFTVAAAGPGIFTFGSNRAVAQNEDFSLNTGANSAKVGTLMTIYLTGEGALDNPIPSGSPTPASPLSRPTLATSLTIGGQAAEVFFLGMTPGFAGFGQATIRVPDVPAGDQPVIITIGGVASNAPVITVSR